MDFWRLILILLMALSVSTSALQPNTSNSTNTPEEEDRPTTVCLASKILGSSFVAAAAASAAMLPLTPISRRALLSSEVLVALSASARAVALMVTQPELEHWCPDLRLGDPPNLGVWGSVLDIAPSSGLVSSCGALYVAVVGATAPPSERVSAPVMVTVALLALLVPLSLSWVLVVPSAATRALTALAALGVAGAFARRGPGVRSAALRLQAEVTRATFTKMAIGGRRVPGRLGLPRPTLAAAVAMAAAADIVLAPSLACLNVVSAVIVDTLTTMSFEAEQRVFQLDVTLLILELALALALGLANALLAHHHSCARKTEDNHLPNMSTKAVVTRWLSSRGRPSPLPPLPPIPPPALPPRPMSPTSPPSHCFEKWPHCDFSSQHRGSRTIFTVGELQAEQIEPRRLLRTFWKEDWKMEPSSCRLHDDPCDDESSEWPHLYEEVDLSQSDDRISSRLPMLSKSTQVNLPPKFTKTCSDWESSESDDEDDGRPTDDHSALFSTASTTSATLSPSVVAAAAAAALSFEWLPSSTASFWQRKRRRKRRRRKRRRRRPTTSISALELSFAECGGASSNAGGVGGSTCSSESAANSFDVRFYRRTATPKLMTLDLGSQNNKNRPRHHHHHQQPVQLQEDISPDSAVVVDLHLKHLAQRWLPGNGLSASTACLRPSTRSPEEADWGLGTNSEGHKRRGATSLNQLQDAECGDEKPGKEPPGMVSGRRTFSLDWAVPSGDPFVSTGFYGDNQWLYDSGASFSHCPVDLDEHEAFSYV